MTYEPPRGKLLSTAWRLCNLIAASTTAQSALKAADATEALTKISTYTEEGMPFPRCLILEQDIKTESDSLGNNIIDVQGRLLGAEFFIYSLTDNELRATDEWTGAADDAVRLQDHHNYIMHRFSNILEEMMALSGTPGYLSTYDPMVYQPELVPWSERSDFGEVAKGDEALPLWYGILGFHIR